MTRKIQTTTTLFINAKNANYDTLTQTIKEAFNDTLKPYTDKITQYLVSPNPQKQKITIGLEYANKHDDSLFEQIITALLNHPNLKTINPTRYQESLTTF